MALAPEGALKEEPIVLAKVLPLLSPKVDPGTILVLTGCEPTTCSGLRLELPRG